MGVLHQALEIIFVHSEINFEVQRKLIKKTWTSKKKKLSNLRNVFFFSLNPSYFQTS
jgi:hypothetical protein